MKIGIIAEFNPLHSGHIHLIQTVKNDYPDAHIYVIMSTFLTQRGEFSFISPQKKVIFALQNDVDFVFELPPVFSAQRADLFAFGAIDVCKKLQLDAIAFGVENLDFFNTLNTPFSKTELNSKTPYLSKINTLNQKLSQTVEWEASANNILAYFYHNAAYTHYPKLKLIPIQRVGANYNDTNLKTEIASATALRCAVTSNQLSKIKAFIPYSPEELFPHITWDNLYPFFIQMLLTIDDTTAIATMGKSGLDQRMKKAAHCPTFETFIQAVKTKAYTVTSIQRAMLFTLLNITQQELDTACDYTASLPPRLLGAKKELTPQLKVFNTFSSYAQIENIEHQKILKKIEVLFYTHLKQSNNQHFPLIY